jgi:hypothetical protein
MDSCAPVYHAETEEGRETSERKKKERRKKMKGRREDIKENRGNVRKESRKVGIMPTRYLNLDLYIVSLAGYVIYIKCILI